MFHKYREISVIYVISFGKDTKECEMNQIMLTIYPESLYQSDFYSIASVAARETEAQLCILPLSSPVSEKHGVDHQDGPGQIQELKLTSATSFNGLGIPGLKHTHTYTHTEQPWLPRPSTSCHSTFQLQASN